MKIQKSWFTLIEILISISIFSIIMVSIISVYFISTDITYKSYVNRIIHENTKNIIVTISEDVMKNSIKWVSKDFISSDCYLPDDIEKVKKWDKLCVWDSSQYYLALKNDVLDSYTRAEPSVCEEEEKQCYIVKNAKPLTNNLVKVTNLEFFVTDDEVRKVTMLISLRPSKKSWVRRWIIKSTKLTTQITLSERKYKD